MRHHCIDVQYNTCMHKTMVTNCPQGGVTILIYMSGTIICADTSSSTQKQLEYFPKIILTYQHYQDPHSVCFPKGSRSREDEYLFAGISEICIDALGSKVHETEIESGLNNTVYYLSSIVTRLVSQVIISNAKVPDSTRITDTEEEVF